MREHTFIHFNHSLSFTVRAACYDQPVLVILLTKNGFSHLSWLSCMLMIHCLSRCVIKPEYSSDGSRFSSRSKRRACALAVASRCNSRSRMGLPVDSGCGVDGPENKTSCYETFTWKLNILLWDQNLVKLTFTCHGCKAWETLFYVVLLFYLYDQLLIEIERENASFYYWACFFRGVTCYNKPLYCPYCHPSLRSW